MPYPERLRSVDPPVWLLVRMVYFCARSSRHSWQPMRARVRDGRLEIEPQELAVELVDRDGLLVISPIEALRH